MALNLHFDVCWATKRCIMAEIFGTHIIGACDAGYDYHSSVVDSHMQKIESMNETIRQLTNFQQEINRQRPTGRIDLNTPEGVQMVDAMREVLPRALDSHTYFWNNEKEIDNLMENINQEIRLLTNKIQPETSKMAEAFDNRKTLITEFNKLMKELIELCSRMIRQQRV